MDGPVESAPETVWASREDVTDDARKRGNRPTSQATVGCHNLTCEGSMMPSVPYGLVKLLHISGKRLPRQFLIKVQDVGPCLSNITFAVY